MKRWMFVLAAVAISLSPGRAADRDSPDAPFAPLPRLHALSDEQAKLARRQLVALEKNRSLLRQAIKMKKTGKLGSPLPPGLAFKQEESFDENAMNVLKRYFFSTEDEYLSVCNDTPPQECLKKMISMRKPIR